VDGNHYAYLATQPGQWNSTNLIGYGGGGLQFYGTTPTSGNSVVSGAYFAHVAGGTADCFNVSASSSANYVNLVTFVRPQCNAVPQELSSWNPLPAYNTNTQQMFNADSHQLNIVVIAPDLELYNSTYNITWPNNPTFTLLGPGPGAGGWSGNEATRLPETPYKTATFTGPNSIISASYSGITAFVSNTPVTAVRMFGALLGSAVSGCSTWPTIVLKANSTTVATLTIAGSTWNYDTGAISVAIPSGAAVTWGNTPGSGCSGGSQGFSATLEYQ
jgi:hypothetical protein